jgi:L-Ala-D/L-Glu epimerase
VRAELTTMHATVPPVGNAREQWDVRSSVRLILHGDDGRLALGEAAPLPGISRDNLPSARDALEAIVWPKEPLSSLGEIDSFCARIDSPAARFAAETALLTLLAQSLEVPLWVLFAPEAHALPLARVLWGDDLRYWLVQARDAMEMGSNTLKVKVGRAGRMKEEIEWLTELRRFVGPEIFIRIDLNGALAPEAASEFMALLGPIAPELVEEPTSYDRVMDCWQSHGMPLALDESLIAHDRWEPALASGKISAVMLKPTLLGGFFACWRLASRARAHSVDAIVTHTLEGPVARAACGHLALAMASPRAVGLGPHPALLPLSDGLIAPWIEGGSIEPPASPGLGLEVAW